MLRTACLASLVMLCAPLALCDTSDANLASGAVTTEKWTGQLGDQLWLYMRGKWIAHQLNLPFVYRPFKYSDQLALHTKEPRLGSVEFGSLQSVKIPEKATATCLPTNGSPKLYTVDYCATGYAYKQSETFEAEMRELICPRNPIKKIALPPNAVSIAVHIRKGVPTDTSFMIASLPTKFPPNEFYITALKSVIELLGTETPIYIRIFTDHERPDLIAAMLKKQINHPYATFSWRDPETTYDNLILEDFFSFLDFDCLIRPWSNFSRVPEVLGNHAIVAKLDETLRRKQNPQFEICISSTHTMWKKVGVNPPQQYVRHIAWQ